MKTSRKLENRHRALVAEWDRIDTQLDDLADLRTWPGPLDPAQLERLLMARAAEIEYELEALFFSIIGGNLPPGWL